MNKLPVRLTLFVVLPAVLGGMAAWATRPMPPLPGSPDGTGDEGTSKPSTSAPVAGKPRRVEPSPMAGALAEQRRYCERLRTADLAQMMEMLKEAGAIGDAFQRRSLESVIYEQMARTDPEGAYALLRNLGSTRFEEELLRAWAKVDGEAALTWAEGNDWYCKIICNGLDPDDVDSFVKILPRVKPEWLAGKLGSAFLRLGSRNPDEARFLLEVLTDPRQKNTASIALAEGWARRDATAAYAWARELSDPAQRESALRGVFLASAESDPKGTAARLNELTKDPAMAASAAGESPLRAVVRAWAAEDPKAATAWLRTRSQEDETVSFNELLTSEILPSRDEWKATELADLIRQPGEKVVTENANGVSPYDHHTKWGNSVDGEDDFMVIGEYGAFKSPLNERVASLQQTGTFVRIADPSRAFDELSQQPGDAARGHVLHEVAAQWVEKDPQAAMAKLRQTTDPWLKLGLINALSEQARRTLDPQLAAEIAGHYPEDSAYSGKLLLTNIYTNLAKRDPAKAEAMLQGDLDAATKASIAASLASRQATYDPAGALGWAASQTNENLRREATLAAVRSWAGSDAYAASEWLAGQPAGPAREAAVVGLVDVVQTTAPADALQWAATLTDPERKESVQVNVVQNLALHDLARAREFAAGLTLSGANRKELQSFMDNVQKIAD